MNGKEWEDTGQTPGTVARPGVSPAMILLVVVVLCHAVPGLAAPGNGGPAPGVPSGQDIAVVFDPGSQAPPLGSILVDGLPGEVLDRLLAAGMTPAEWSRVFAVRTGDRHRDDLPAILGSYTIAGGAVHFRPHFPFTAGVTYHARFDPGALLVALQASSRGRDEDAAAASSDPGEAIDGSEIIDALFTIPEPDSKPSTRVEAIYPSGDQVPENLLRVYVHFSAPMRARDVHRHVHLYDSAGEEIELPFVEIDEGLWDPGRRRLTLFFHPGRLKRGVGPNLAMGPPLSRGRNFRLVIDARFPDTMGLPLAKGFEKVLQVGAADRASPEPGQWVLLPPAGNTDPVSLDFPEPMDHALLQRLVAVEDGSGRRIAGDVSVTRGETRWSLTPDGGWSPGDYAISIHPALEDLAGNTSAFLFEETSSTGDPDSSGELHRLRFRIEDDSK